MAHNQLSKGKVSVGAIGIGGASGLANPPAAGVDPITMYGAYLVSATVNPGSSVAAGVSYTTTVTITGVRAGDAIVVIPPATLPTGLGADAWVSAADTLTVTVQNCTAAPITTSSQTWQFLWFKLKPNG